MLLKKAPVLITFLCATLVIPTVSGCSVKVGGSGDAQSAPPPPEPQPEPKAEEPKPEPKDDKPKKSKATVKGNAVSIPGNIVFDSGLATFRKEDEKETLEVLEQLKLFLDENAQVSKLRIEGHTDDVGNDADNEKLSGERALAIKKWLVDHEVAKERVLAVGFGEKKPIADNKTEAGKAQNRRTEFRIAEIRGKPYLGRPVDGGGKVFDL